MSPISSKKIVPLFANSNLPILPFVLALVNAPLEYPNSSLSSKLSGMAEQLIAIKGSLHLLLS
jgi:hypothetical protein